MEGDGIERDGIRQGDAVVITGGGGGFGRAFALRFAREGARVAIWDVNHESGAETVREVAAQGGEARLFQVDLAEPAAIAAAARDTLAALDTPFCVINNASIYPRASVLEMPLETWNRTLGVNITAPFLVAKAFGGAMIAARRGVVINIASGRALEGAANGVGYAATKAAILNFTKTLALEWAPHNIRVNAIIPGVSFTAQPLENTTPDELLSRGRKVPLGRIGYPNDVA
ncbi:MAG TPA: SDR family oxidoreductase, partial [Beijerinckiaceae bacterium]|nr:SDR family oxidoreductase [Beijerinckiaceae bacterium]